MDASATEDKELKALSEIVNILESLESAESRRNIAAYLNVRYNMSSVAVKQYLDSLINSIRIRGLHPQSRRRSRRRPRD